MTKEVNVVRPKLVVRPKKGQRDVPVGEIGDVVDAFGGVIDVIMTNSQISEEADNYEFTSQEVDELRAAYTYESEYGAWVHQYRYIKNKYGKDNLRSSQDILEAAEQRQL